MRIIRRPALIAVLLGLLAVRLADAFQVGSLFRFVVPKSPEKSARASLLYSSRGDGTSPPATTRQEERKDYSGQASALFGNVRVPAALFAGASGAAAFALSVSSSDTVVAGFIKRLYALLMLGALSCQLVAIVVSTVAMARMAYYQHAPSASLDEFIRVEYNFEWVTVLFNFFFGMFSFVLASGIRAWISIGCPVVAKAALGIIVSCTLLATGFLRDAYGQHGESFLQLPADYGKLLFANARRSPLFAVALVLLITTHFYIVIKLPHLYRHLLKQ